MTEPCRDVARSYEPPRIDDLGTLAELTGLNAQGGEGDFVDQVDVKT